MLIRPELLLYYCVFVLFICIPILYLFSSLKSSSRGLLFNRAGNFDESIPLRMRVGLNITCQPYTVKTESFRVMLQHSFVLLLQTLSQFYNLIFQLSVLSFSMDRNKIPSIFYSSTINLSFFTSYCTKVYL